ncbi:FAD-binding oxidoreductase [Halalkalibacter okhensis]|uniref:FAD-linked oxidase n=1 Tax=Halalkalibacter okhensis TaxID=333138 RepID=A0A0B0IF43_9BACI|nr:FAD-binding oxidoreductase [Halalkalibacter okhensis]KHF41213.1 FAD-linked oxidase [Halalkalibacter okhensis]
MKEAFLERLLDAVGSQTVIQEKAMMEKLSKDYFWYSPVLEMELTNKKADYVAIPDSHAQLRIILQLAVDEKIPVTLRGAGTGNYGQAVPMNGGIVVDLSKLNQIVNIGDGFVTVQSGMRIRDLEKQIHKTDQELTIYPSTFVKATIGGFIAGGSGGIGSVTWGNLWDGNVLEARVLTMNETITELTLSGDELLDYIHSYGTTGIITEVTIPIKQKKNWVQEVVRFEHFHEALQFSRGIAEGNRWSKRLVSVMEAPIPTFFRPLKKIIESEKEHWVLVEIAEENHSLFKEEAMKYNGISNYTAEANAYRKGIGISDFTWNHTTLWALKDDKKWTYLQNFFLIDEVQNQINLIKERFGEEVLVHIEWLRDRGRLVPAGLPLVKFTSKERLYEVIAYFNEIGAAVNDPHTYLLGAGGWDLQLESISKKKKENDPYNLLNQEKMPSPDLVQELI